MLRTGKSARRGRAGAFTLTELLVALALGGLVLTVMGMLFLFGLRSFAGLGNYASLSGQSHVAFDRISRDLREATGVVSAMADLPVRTLVLTNAFEGSTVTYEWDSETGILTSTRGDEPARIELTSCDYWGFFFFQRSPTNSWQFCPTTDLSLCKLVSLSWRCSRTVLGEKVNSESLLTAQFVLRNKP